jgi:HTH-type transcriptional regulator / antitoxin HigA
MMDVRALHTEADYEWALSEIERYFDNLPEPGSPEGDRFDVLATLVEAYEDEHHPIPDTTDPIDVLHFAIENMGRSQAELASLLGSRSRASEILSRRRPLTLDMIRKINETWRIPTELLTKSYMVERVRSPRPGRKVSAPRRRRIVRECA